MLKVTRWNVNDAIVHDHLRMCITNLTVPNVTRTILFTCDIRLYAFHKYTVDVRLCIKFSANIMPLVS
jgi:hypothetical protein